MFAISTSTSIFARSEQCCFPVPDVFRCTHGKVVRVEIFENLQRLSRYQRGECGAAVERRREYREAIRQHRIGRFIFEKIEKMWDFFAFFCFRLFFALIF